MNAPYPRPESRAKRSEDSHRALKLRLVLYVLLFVFAFTGLVHTHRSLSWWGITIVRYR